MQTATWIPGASARSARYYIDAGAGGLAVGVHSTQFAIREAGLYEPVLRLAAETAASWTRRPARADRRPGRRTEQAQREAAVAIDLVITPGCSASPR